jgi:hypothetical protein
VPRLEPRSEIFAGFAQRNFPRVLGYMETELKRGANLDLFIPRDGQRAPLLASWRYGRGKSVALTMDMESRFSRNWIPWSGLQDFWDKIAGWLRPEPEAVPLHEARVSLVDMRPFLDLYVYEEASANSQFSISIGGKTSASTASLKKVAPGHFQTALPISEPGDYKIELAEVRRDRRISLPALSYSLPYTFNSEVPRPSFNTALLARLAQASGGEINPRPRDVAIESEMTDRFAPQRAPLIVAAFLLFLVEVAVRKFFLSEAD